MLNLTFSADGTLRHEKETPGDETRFTFGEDFSGTLTVGPLTQTVRGRECRMFTKPLADGIYTPVLRSGKTCVRLEPLEQKNGVLRPAELGGDALRALRGKTEALGEEVRALREELARLRQTIEGTKLF